MEKERNFPAVITAETTGTYYGIAGLRLESILKAELAKKELFLFSQGYADDEDRETSWDVNGGIESLLQAISGWPADTTLEMLINACPDLDSRPRGQLDIGIIIRTTGKSREEVMEKAISRYLALASLLPTHQPEADFIPITDRRELSRTLKPFEAKAALAVRRRARDIALTQPLRQPSTVGFGQAAAADQDNDRQQAVNHIFPWKPAADTRRRLLDTLLAQLDPVQFVVRIKKATDRDKQTAMARLEQAILNCELFLSAEGHAATVLRRQAESLRDLSLSQLAGLQEYGFRLGVYLLAAGRLDPSLGPGVGSPITETTTSEKLVDILRGGFRQVEISPEKAADPGYFHEAEPFTLREAAGAFRLPAPPAENQLGLPAKNFRTCLARLPAADRGKDAITLAVNRHRHLAQPILATTDDRMRHTFIIGQTGTGKSTMMESMILQDIRAGRGVAVIDPTGRWWKKSSARFPPGGGRTSSISTSWTGKSRRDSTSCAGRPSRNGT
jgi:hypothetical protein